MIDEFLAATDIDGGPARRADEVALQVVDVPVFSAIGSKVADAAGSRLRLIGPQRDAIGAARLIGQTGEGDGLDGLRLHGLFDHDPAVGHSVDNDAHVRRTLGDVSGAGEVAGDFLVSRQCHLHRFGCRFVQVVEFVLVDE